MADMRKIFIVLGASLAAAFLITAFFISNYGPSGTYALTSVLLKPDILEKLNYNDFNSKTSEQDRFIFDRIVFEEIGNPVEIDIKKYQKIYNLLSSDVSTPQNGDFAHPLSKLTIYVKTESPSAWQFLSKPFQQVQVSGTGDSYRVLLHEDNKGTHWVEFPHQGIGKQIEAAVKS